MRKKFLKFCSKVCLAGDKITESNQKNILWFGEMKFLIYQFHFISKVAFLFCKLTKYETTLFYTYVLEIFFREKETYFQFRKISEKLWQLLINNFNNIHMNTEWYWIRGIFLESYWIDISGNYRDFCLSKLSLRRIFMD